MSVPGLPPRRIFDAMTENQRLGLLYETVQQIHDSMVVTDQALANQISELRRELSGRLDKAEHEIKAASDRLDSMEEN